MNSENLLLNILELKDAIKYLEKKHATERTKYNKYGEKNFSQIKQSEQLHLLQFISSNLSNTRRIDGMMNTFFYCQVNGYVHVTPHIHSYRHTHGHVAIVLWPRVSTYSIVLCTLHLLYEQQRHREDSIILSSVPVYYKLPGYVTKEDKKKWEKRKKLPRREVTV